MNDIAQFIGQIVIENFQLKAQLAQLQQALAEARKPPAKAKK